MVISRLSKIVAAIFLLVCFCLFTTPVKDGDCFWHIATGLWIWDHKSLPVTDPFTFTFSQQITSSVSGFILSQYWLGQLALAAIWKAAGSTGIVIFRAFTYCTILLFLFAWLRKRHNEPFALLMLLPLASIFASYPNERPQLFTFLMMPLVLWLLEKLRETGRPSTLHLVSLPAAMLIWANCHGGYILGTLCTVIYLITMYLRPSGIENPGKNASAFAMIATLTASTLNPNGINAFVEIFRMQSSAPVVQEFLSPFRAARELHLWFPEYWLVLALLVYTIVTKLRAMQLQHLLTLVMLAALSLTSLRYIPFLLMATPVMALYLPVVKPDRITWGAALICFSLFIANSDWRETFSFSPDRLFPASAVRFLSAAAPAPELFNYYDWGGYLLLHSPGTKTFTDGRGLSVVVNGEYEDALWTNRWRDVFARYKINSVLIPAISKSTGATFPLATNLGNSGEWSLIYRDKTALLFIRNTPDNSTITDNFSLNPLELQKHILDLLEMTQSDLQYRLEFWLSRGNAQALLGDYPSANISFKKALSIDPGNQWASIMFRQTGIH